MTTLRQADSRPSREWQKKEALYVFSLHGDKLLFNSISWKKMNWVRVWMESRYCALRLSENIQSASYSILDFNFHNQGNWICEAHTHCSSLRILSVGLKIPFLHKSNLSAHYSARQTITIIFPYQSAKTITPVDIQVLLSMAITHGPETWISAPGIGYAHTSIQV